MSTPRTYSFTASGESPQDVAARKAQTVRSPPVGIKTPLELGENTDGLLKMHYKVEDTISDNLRNLILTNKGERLMDYEFGANLQELTFELCSEDTDMEAVRRIRSAASRYLPYVNLETFEPFNVPGPGDSIARIGVRIGYRIPLISTTEKKIEITLYTAG